MLERSRSVVRAVDFDAESWRASAAIPVLGIVVLFAAAPLGAWAAVMAGLVAAAAYLAFIRQQHVDLEYRLLAEDLALAADAHTPWEPDRRRRVAALSDRIAHRLSLDEAQRREIAIAVAIRSIGHTGLRADQLADAAGRSPEERARGVARTVSGWDRLAGIVAGSGPDARSADIVTIIDIAERFDGLRRQGLGVLPALNLIGADSSNAERRVLEALNDLSSVPPAS